MDAKPFYLSRTFWLLLATIFAPLIARWIGPGADKDAIQTLIVNACETIVPLFTASAAIYTRAKTPAAPLTLTKAGAEAINNPPPSTPTP